MVEADPIAAGLLVVAVMTAALWYVASSRKRP